VLFIEREAGMALCRCLEKHSPPKGRKKTYSVYVFPIEYPSASLICGICDNPGVIWLTTEEANQYNEGKTIFDGPSNFARMRADDSGLKSSKIL
jgi:hypothetical protein